MLPKGTPEPRTPKGREAVVNHGKESSKNQSHQWMNIESWTIVMKKLNEIKNI